MEMPLTSNIDGEVSVERCKTKIFEGDVIITGNCEIRGNLTLQGTLTSWSIRDEIRKADNNSLHDIINALDQIRNALYRRL
jgi:hypothetical protein